MDRVRQSHIADVDVVYGGNGRTKMTHEEFIQAVRNAAAGRLDDAILRQQVLRAKVVYGQGRIGVRGICHYEAWENENLRHEFVEIGAFCEESPLQLAGTTIHELAHVIAGRGAGHGRTWRMAAATLGLIRSRASDQQYEANDFAPDLKRQIDAIGAPLDGTPILDRRTRPRMHGCPAGIGTRGGSSRGSGSGSRLRLWVCACPIKVRVASDNFCATCSICHDTFRRNEVERAFKREPI